VPATCHSRKMRIAGAQSIFGDNSVRAEISSKQIDGFNGHGHSFSESNTNKL